MSRINFSLDDDDHKSFDFNGETVTFTCQLLKIKISNRKRIDNFRPKKETEELKFSKAKNCEAVIEQTRRKPQKTIEIKPTQTNANILI